MRFLMTSLRSGALLVLAAALPFRAPVHAQEPPPLAIVAVPAEAADRSAIVMATYRDRTQLATPCPRGPSADIIVCGRWLGENARARLPLPVDPSESTGIARGELPTASANYGKSGGCSVVGGQTTGCTGSFNGAKAMGVVVKAVTALIDPDGDYAPPPDVPDRFHGAGQH